MKRKKDKAPSFGRHAEFQARKLMLRAAMWIFMPTSSYNMQSEEEVEKRTRIGPVNKLKIGPNLFPSLSFFLLAGIVRRRQKEASQSEEASRDGRVTKPID